MVIRRERIRFKQKFFNALHLGGVYTCMGVTAIGTALIFYKGFDYLFNVRPVNKALNEKKKQLLLQEGMSPEFTEKLTTEETL